MSTITKERVAGIARGEKCYTHDDVVKLARIALASLEAEPVAWTNQRSLDVRDKITAFTCKESADIYGEKSAWSNIVPLYSAHPAPVSVPDFGALTKCIVQRLVDYGAADDDAIACAEEFVYNACRAAMLQGAEPVTTAYKLPSPIKDNHLNSGPDADDYYSGYQAGWNEILEAVSGNPQAITDGWKLVPVDMTPEQMRAVQLKSELGSYAAANLTGAYSLFREFWDVAVTAATQRGERK